MGVAGAVTTLQPQLRLLPSRSHRHHRLRPRLFTERTERAGCPEDRVSLGERRRPPRRGGGPRLVLRVRGKGRNEAVCVECGRGRASARADAGGVHRCSLGHARTIRTPEPLRTAGTVSTGCRSWLPGLRTRSWAPSKAGGLVPTERTACARSTPVGSGAGASRAIPCATPTTSRGCRPSKSVRRRSRGPRTRRVSTTAPATCLPAVGIPTCEATSLWCA